MSFDQTNNQSTHHQAQGEQQQQQPLPDVGLPRLSSEEWDYQRYRPATLPFPTNYRSPSPDYANRHDNYAYASSSWKQNSHPYSHLPQHPQHPQHYNHHQQQQLPPPPPPPPVAAAPVVAQIPREYGYAPPPVQPGHLNTGPYDPVRSNYTELHEDSVPIPVPVVAPAPALAPALPPAPPPVQQNRSSTAISPVMSISQLLSSSSENNNNNSNDNEEPTYSPKENLFEPAHRNGIQSLLNNEDEEEKYNMADSDTDTEDIPLMTSPKAAIVAPMSTATILPTTILTPVKEARIMENGNNNNNNNSSNNSNGYHNHQHNYQHQHQSEDSDSDSSDIILSRKGKPSSQRAREELELSDGNEDDDDEILMTHREEMIQFMIQVHRRKKRVIDEYKKSHQRKHSYIREGIEKLYEKRYGTSMPKKNSIVIGKKRPRALSDVGDTTDSEDHIMAPTATNAVSAAVIQKSNKQTAAQKMEDERRKVWLNIARKDVPRMTRILSRVQATRSGNCKKVAQYCQKEVRRAITNGGRANREQQNKAKRAMKEMLLFWKKNEKEERELRKKAEKEALDKLKQEEERREAQRQARKLNFLITQTELYSHFIGRKIKQDTSEDDETAAPAASGLSTPLAPVAESDELDANAGVQAIGEVDFDEEDEAVLKEKARLSAQNALAKQREQTRQFDEGARERRIAAGDNPDANLNPLDLDDMNFQEPSSMGSGPEVQQPNMLMCQLKSYQLKGLNWLANLYEQGINGILADEMGLGKTVQSISLLAYLAEVHNIWGPFLVIAPASTLHNWQQEFTKFVPQFRALPYWGNPKERKILRQFWNRKQLYGKDAPFHIVITSYQLVLTDVSYFQRVKWQYMVLDEAQAIKSSSSARWKQLLGFHCRNRLLLTGTPIQNSMQELWALLHFIMPTLFDSHEEFSEWFSKDIESHAENRGSLNEHQLRRLHMILKPFMLRRIKRNVQHELGEKIEVEIYCDLTARQKAFYRGLKEKISISELLEKATSLSDLENMDSLMNLVMQFRKVCNHPELFERADVESPLSFCEYSQTGSLSKETLLYCPYSSKNPIKFQIPKKLYRNGGILKTVSPDTRRGFEVKYVHNMFNIWNDQYIYENSHAGFSFLKFCQMSPHEASYLFKANLISRWIAALAKRAQYVPLSYKQNDDWSIPEKSTSPFNITPVSLMSELTNLSDNMIYDTHLYGQCYQPPAHAVPIDMICNDISFIREQQEVMFNTDIRSCFFGTPQYISRTEPEEASNLRDVVRTSLGQEGIMTVPSSGYGFSWMRVPSMKDLILDSGKLAALDKLLDRLKSEGHRCLVYFQMTRMIDLFEEYIAYKQYKYLRLDGSSKISDRRDMVQDWQTRPEIFIFLLSTRAGGLGINLTAADTVIFYDSDWNPTVDQQAMDRAHRLGQTKQVTVYRLITKGTIEERILQRAKQKDEIQKVVISGGEFRQVDFKPREIVSLLLDDEELEDKLQMQLKRKAEEEEQKEQKKAARPAKRSRKQMLQDQSSKESTPALSPSNVDRLFSAGEDIINVEDESSKKSKSTRIGRPRTNFSFTG